MKTEKGKIFIISPTESVLTKRGDRHTKLAGALSDAGHDVVYISTNFYHAEKRFFTKSEIAQARDNTDYTLKIFSTFSYGDNISLGRLLGYLKVALQSFIFLLFNMRRGDILVVPSRPPEFIIVAKLLKSFKKCRVIIDIRDVWPDGLPLNQSIIHRLFSCYCNLLNWLAMRAADHAFYTAGGFKTWALKYITEDKLSFVPLGYDEERWQNSRPLDKEDFKDSIIKFVFVGDFAKSMEIDGLIKAVAGNERYSLTFIGGGEKLGEVKQLVDSLGAVNIHFLGRLTKQAVVEAMREFHISVVPLNVKFSMPNKLFDALGAMRPLLVYGDNDAAAFVVQHSIGWNLDFGAGQEDALLSELSPDKIIEYSRNIQKIRGKYSKSYLYREMIAKILD